MKRAALVLQVALAVVLTVLWLRWNPISPECGRDGSDCAEAEPDRQKVVFAPTVPVKPDRSSVDHEVHFEVEYGGCALVVMPKDDTIECIYEPGGELRVWVVHPRVDEVELELDGEPWAATSYSVTEEPGRGFRGSLDRDDLERLTVRVPGGGSPSAEDSSWSLRLRALARLTPREQAGLDRWSEGGRDLERRAIEGEAGVVADTSALVKELLEVGLLSKAVDVGLAVSFQLTWRAEQVELAEQVLAKIRSDAERYPEGEAAVAVFAGHVFERRGQLVGAAEAYRRGGRHAVRMDDAVLQLEALTVYAKMLGELGYFEAAAYWGARALSHAREQGEPHALMSIVGMVAWINARLQKAGQAHEDPRPLFREFLARSSELESVPDIATARSNLADLAALDGEPGSALRYLDELDEAGLTTEQRIEARALRLRALRASKATGARVERARRQLESALRPLLAEESRDWAPPSLRWLAATRWGEVLEREGDLEGARAAYEGAEQLLDQVVPLALIGIRAEAAPARRREGTLRLVSVLLEQGHPEQALCVLREAQARVGQLARLVATTRESLDEKIAHYLEAKREYEALLHRADELPTTEREQVRREAVRRHAQLDRDALEILATWPGYQGRPSCDELSPRDEGELILGLYPRGEDLLVFAQDDSGTTHRVVSDYESLARAGNAEWLGSMLLDPLDERLAASSRVRVLASGEAAAVDVHALPWRERPLVAHRPVVYGLDLPPLPPRPQSQQSQSQQPQSQQPQSQQPQQPQRVHDGTGRALVVADVLADGTEHEATEVEEALLGVDWAVERSRSDEQSAGDVREKLTGVDHFHYAGHAYYDVGGTARRAGQRAGGDDDAVLRLWPPYPGGAAAEPSYIELGRSGHLDVQDILMMSEVPRSVVLMGCATGVNDERMAYGGFSLATAFLAAGAEVVVASTRDVDGWKASLIGQGLYTQFDPRGVEDPAEWFMSAVRWARDNGLPPGAVQDYRVFVP